MQSNDFTKIRHFVEGALAEGFTEDEAAKWAREIFPFQSVDVLARRFYRDQIARDAS